MGFSSYDSRPWLARYADGYPTHIKPRVSTLVEAFSTLVQQGPDYPQMDYFGTVTSRAQLDAHANVMAAFLLEQGFTRGDRLAIYAQNNPAFVVALLATWKLGGIAVAINPMNKGRELAYVLKDADIKALVALDTLYVEVVQPLLEADPHITLPIRLTFSALDGQSLNDARVLGTATRLDAPSGVQDLQALLSNGEQAPAPRATPEIQPDDVALLAYTSGTTGEPKGAMLTHYNLVANAMTYESWVGLGPDDVNLCIAPLFHITGMVAHAAASLLTGSLLVLTHRFHAETMLEAIRRTRPTYTIGAITAFISMMNTGQIQPGDFDSFKVIQSGGAPVSAAITEQFEKLTGHYIHNAYGMTETSSVSLIVPSGRRAPVDEASSALSIGVPVFGTTVRIINEAGEAAAIGEIGELVKKGPQVMKGYWNKPEATEAAMPDGFLRSGDVGFMDADGWFFLVDRKTDMINAGGYKVWPREVEDVMYGHPAVREVAIVGMPDDYRGETVKAFVSLKEDNGASEAELIAFARTHMSSYKVPRFVEFLDELPKTNTGKILRRELKALA